MPYELRAEQFIALPIDKVFEFFSDAHNLEAITPAFLNFKVLTPDPIVLAEGTLLDYRIKLHGIPIRWRTRISKWNPPVCFVDEQLKGPYRQWIHTHSFESRDGGTMVRDHVLYNHWGGGLIDRFFVRKDLQKIFEHRKTTIERLLLGPKAQPAAV